ncbi:MAG: thiamine phosphate synthase [Betaproteobacteria bacterium]
MTATDLRARRLARLRGLYAVTPDASDTGALVARCAAALDGGASAIQFRHKGADAALGEAQARAIVALCRSRGALAIVNDDAALAARVDADGVHVGEHDGGVASARARVGPSRLVGASCYDSLALARSAIDAGADYVAFGSFFSSGTKPHARRAGLDLIPRACALGVPVVAIGGIDAANARALADAGVDAVAVIAAVFAHDDPRDVADAARRIVASFASRAPAHAHAPGSGPEPR